MTYEIRKVADGLGFAEGPLWLADGRLLVTDIASGWIRVVEPESSQVVDWVKVAGGPNGLAVGPDALYAAINPGIAFAQSAAGVWGAAPKGTPPASSGTAGIYRISSAGEVDEVYTEVDGYALQAPNDLVFDADGGMYFTDHGSHSERTIDLGGLYYAAADGTRINELVHSNRASNPAANPNGVSLSPDGSRLYVSDTPTGRVWEWNVVGVGVLEAPKDAEPNTGARHLLGIDGYRLFDSMTVDSAGFLLVGTLRHGGVTVISPEGELVDFIELPDGETRVTNICFGGPDLSTAFVTGSGHGRLWAIDWPRPGLELNYQGTFTLD